MSQYQSIPNGSNGSFDTKSWFEPVLKQVDFTGKTVVDYGCAEGVMSLLAHDSGASMVSGVDIDEERLEIARKLVPSGKFTYARVEAYQKYSDIGIFSMIIHWLSDPQTDLRNILHYVEQTAVVIFREANDGYTPDNGNWFPTLSEIDTYFKSCSFECEHTELLQTQDNDKNIYLKIFRRTKRILFADPYVVKVGKFRKGWKDDFGVLKNALHLPTPYFGDNFYISKRIDGQRLCDLPEVDRDKLQSFLKKLETVFYYTNLMFTDLSPGNVIYDGEFHIIDFDEIGAWDENNNRWRELCES